ncbi:MAG: isocitrate/isopropylmalate family dehydrogenase [Bdellovibrionota bacterium]
MKTLVVIPGDGIGPEVTSSVIEVLKAVNAPFEYQWHEAGESALEKQGDLLPATTLEAIAKSKLAIKGPTNTPKGGGHKSINVRLRQHFDLYANVRPVTCPPGVKAVNAKTDLTIVRENTEDLYTGVERMVDDDTAEAIKRITKKGSSRIARHAMQLAVRTGKQKVVVVHKANIMKLTDGLFLRTCMEVAAEFPQLKVPDLIIDNCCMQLVTRPEQFEVIVTQNLYGDILSDLCAGLVGGLGVVPGANIGDSVAIFEAVHGSAPDIAGQNKANPTALLQSAVMLLEYVGEKEKALAMKKAIFAALANVDARTGDLGGKGSTTTFTQAILEALG